MGKKSDSIFPKSELRYDPVSGEWILVSPGRFRPSTLREWRPKREIPPKSKDIFKDPFKTVNEHIILEYVKGKPSAEAAPKKRMGSPTLFTHAQPVAHTDKNGETTCVCICCESIIEADDEERVCAYLDKYEVVWCSRECAKEFPMDAYLIANRYKRHWSSVALEKDEVDERSRVREITSERMNALKELAKKQGY